MGRVSIFQSVIDTSARVTSAPVSKSPFIDFDPILHGTNSNEDVRKLALTVTWVFAAREWSPSSLAAKHFPNDTGKYNDQDSGTWHKSH